MADIFDRVGQQLATPAQQPASQPATGDIFAQVGNSLANQTPATGGNDLFSSVASSLTNGTQPAPVSTGPTFGQQLGAGITQLVSHPLDFARDIAPATLGDRAGAVFNAGAGELINHPLAFAAAIPGAVKDEGVDTLKEGAQAIPRALSQTSGAGASALYRTIGAAATALGGDATPYIEAAKKSAGFSQKNEEFYSPTEGALNNPYGAAGITRAVGPSIVQASTAFASAPLQYAVIGTTVLGTSTEEFDASMAKQYPDMDPGKRSFIALGLGAVNAAAQTALEKYSPFQKLAHGMGPEAATSLIRKLAWASGTGALNESLQQLPEEAIKLGIDPSSPQLKASLKAIFDSGFYGAFGEAAAPIIHAGVGKIAGGEAAPVSSPTNGPATAADIRAADAAVQPVTPLPISQSVIKSREGDTKGQPIQFADDYAKAQYIVSRPDFRGDLKTIAEQYVAQTDAYRAASPTGAGNERSDLGTQPPVPGPTGSDQSVATPNVSDQAAVPVGTNPSGGGLFESVAANLDPATVVPAERSAGAVQDVASSVADVPAGENKEQGVSESVPAVQARRPVDRTTAVERMKATFKDADIDVAPKNQQEARMRKAMQSKGLEVVFYDSKADHAGITSPETPGVLFIKRGQGADGLHESLLHEFGHDIQNNNPDLFKQIQDAVGVKEGGREAAVVPFGEVANNAQVRAKLDPTIINKIKALLSKFVAKFNGTNNPVVDKALELLDQNFGTAEKTEVAPVRTAVPEKTTGFDPLPEVDNRSERPSTQYGYWITKDGKFFPVGKQEHENVAKDNGMKGSSEAIADGAIRVVDEQNKVSMEAREASVLASQRGYIRDALSEGKTIHIETHGDGGIKLDPGIGDTKTLREQALKFNAFVEGKLATTDFFTPKVGKAKPTLKDKLKDAVMEDTETTPRTIIRSAKEGAKGEVASQIVQAKKQVTDFHAAVKREFNGQTFDKLSDADKAGLLAALKGAPIPFVNMGPELQQTISNMRDMIDENTDTIIDQLRQTGRPQDIQLANQLQSNRGFYSNMSYRLFEKPKEQIDAVMKGNGRYATIKADYLGWIDARFKKAGVTLTPAELEGEAKGILQDIAGQGVFGKSNTGQGLTVNPSGAKNIGILKRRQQLPPELRAALGQNLNAAIVFHQTVAKQAAMVAAHDFQNVVREAGLKGGWLHKQRTEGFEEKIARPNDPRSPLSDLHTTPEIAQLMAQHNGTVPAGLIGSFLNLWRKGNAISRQAVTVGSSAAFMANVIGQPGFLIATGNLDPIKYAKLYFPGKEQIAGFGDEHPKVRAILDTLLNGAGTGTPATRAKIDKLTKLGLLNDSVFARDSMEAARELGLDPDTFDDSKIAKAKKLAMTPVKVAQTIYNLSDTRAKLLIYEQGTTDLAKAHPTWTTEQVEREAADRALNTYPSHSRAFGWAREVAKTGIIGPFAVFSAEMLRTTKNNLVYGMKDVIEGGKRQAAGEAGGGHQLYQGLKRYLGTTALAAGVPIVASMLSHVIGGLSDDDEDKLRKQLPPWLQHTTGFFRKTDEHGKYQYYNLSRYLPVLMFSDIYKSLTKGNVLDAAQIAANPVTSEQPLTSRLLDINRNKTQNGSTVFNEEDTKQDKIEKSMIYLLDPLIPDIAKRIKNKIIPALAGESDAGGKPLDPQDEIGRFFGVTIQTIDTGANLERQGSEHNSRIRDANTLFTNPLAKVGTAQESDVVTAYKKSEDARFSIWQDTYAAVQSARHAGLTDKEIQLKLRGGGIATPAGLNVQDIISIMGGKYQPYNFVDNPKYQQARHKFPDKVPQDQLLAIARGRRGMSLDKDR